MSWTASRAQVRLQPASSSLLLLSLPAQAGGTPTSGPGGAPGSAGGSSRDLRTIPTFDSPLLLCTETQDPLLCAVHLGDSGSTCPGLGSPETL